MEKVTVKSLENLQQVVITSSHSLVADEPKPDGDDLGPNPHELLLAALGTCTAMTILMYVRRKGWSLRSVTVECSHQRVHGRDSMESEKQDDSWIELIRRYIRVDGDLTEEQTKRIGYIARRCPVRRTLESSPVIEDELDLVS